MKNKIINSPNTWRKRLKIKNEKIKIEKEKKIKQVDDK